MKSITPGSSNTLWMLAWQSAPLLLPECREDAIDVIRAAALM